jgi:hypothetical protein
MSVNTSDEGGNFGDVLFGDQLRYTGPDEFGGEWAAPSDLHAPYEFRHVSVGGTLTLETCFKGRRYYAPEHPANRREYWEKIDE